MNISPLEAEVQYPPPTNKNFSNWRTFKISSLDPETIHALNPSAFCRGVYLHPKTVRNCA